MSNEPLITIGITSFNSEENIIRALNSAINQTWQNKEIIVVDDFSSDNTAQIIENYIKDFDVFKFFKHKKNYGYPAALNTIIRNSCGEYIAIFDSDDESLNERIYKQYYRFLEYNKINKTKNIICYSNRKVINKSKTNSSQIAYAIGRNEIEPRGTFVADFILGVKVPDKKISYGVFGSCTMFMRKSTFKKVGYFDKSFRRESEHDFAIRAAFKNFHFISVNEPLVIQYKTNAEYKSKKNVLKYSILLNKKYKKYLISKKSYYGSIFLTLTKNYYFRKNKILSYLFYLIALLFLPYDQKIARIYNSKIINYCFNKR